MRLVLPVVLLGVAVLAMSQKKREGGYADSWAVEVRGGETKARELADKHGFVYRGKVSRSVAMCTYVLHPPVCVFRWGA